MTSSTAQGSSPVDGPVDLDALDCFVETALQLEERPRRQLLSGGLSQTTLRYASAGSDPVIVRIPPAHGPLEPYSPSVEASVLRVLESVGLPVPKVRCLERDAGVIGRSFLVTDQVVGDVIQDGARGISQDRRVRLGSEYLRRLVSVHSLADLQPAAWAELRADLDEMPAKTADGVLARWTDALERSDIDVPPFHRFIRHWLAQRVPPAGPESLVHGDYRLANVIWNGDRIAAILDWEEVGVGDPYFDLAWTLMGTDQDNELVMGLTERAAFLADYSDQMGQSIDANRLAWWEIACGWAKLSMEARAIGLIHDGHYRDLRPLLWCFLNRRIASRLLEKIEAYEDARQLQVKE